MKELYDSMSELFSCLLTKKYSTSFTIASKMIDKSIRQDIYNIYGFVRLGDEIVDSFHYYDKKSLLNRFKIDTHLAIKEKISLNPVLNAFQKTVNKYNIDKEFINSFLDSMYLDLEKTNYHTQIEYENYIYGSAEVVGFMCLKVFVEGDPIKFETLQSSAKSLGAAFQKINFIRDIKFDSIQLQRSYFPSLKDKELDESTKNDILEEIEKDFQKAHEGVLKLPPKAKFGVIVVYSYYYRLLNKLKKLPAQKIKNERIRISNYEKLWILVFQYIKYKIS